MYKYATRTLVRRVDALEPESARLVSSRLLCGSKRKKGNASSPMQLTNSSSAKYRRRGKWEVGKLSLQLGVPKAAPPPLFQIALLEHHHHSAEFEKLLRAPSSRGWILSRPCEVLRGHLAPVRVRYRPPRERRDAGACRQHAVFPRETWRPNTEADDEQSAGVACATGASERKRPSAGAQEGREDREGGLEAAPGDASRIEGRAGARLALSEPQNIVNAPSELPIARHQRHPAAATGSPGSTTRSIGVKVFYSSSYQCARRSVSVCQCMISSLRRDGLSPSFVREALGWTSSEAHIISAVTRPPVRTVIVGNSGKV